VLFLLSIACTETGVVAGVPELVVDPGDIDFSDVVVGTESLIGIALRNEGIGRLTITGAELEAGTSPDFRVVEVATDVAGRATGSLGVAYAPTAEEADVGAVILRSDDPDNAEVRVPLLGAGVRPVVDVDPEILYFGVVAAAETKTLPFTVAASGSGDLVIHAMTVETEDAGPWSIALPDGYAEPYTLVNGFSITAQVSFTPTSTDVAEARIDIATNAPDDPVESVLLYGNSTHDPEGDVPPVVEITDPDGGEHFFDDDVVSLDGHVYDADEPATNLTCTWYAAGSPVAAGIADEAGNVGGSATLGAGDVELVLRCFDSTGLYGEDVVSIEVFARDMPVPYTISGGTTSFDYFSVDDDLEFRLDGVTYWLDDSNTAESHPPVVLEAEPGQVIRVIATDENYCMAKLGGLYLHWGTGDRQALTLPACRSACEADACYDEDYEGPWPGVFLDESVEIAIP
jgi:hypothetical protein